MPFNDSKSCDHYNHKRCNYTVMEHQEIVNDCVSECFLPVRRLRLCPAERLSWRLSPSEEMSEPRSSCSLPWPPAHWCWRGWAWWELPHSCPHSCTCSWGPWRGRAERSHPGPPCLAGRHTERRHSRWTVSV